MAEYLHPGVYVEEVSSGVRPIEGVGTSTAGFIGKTAKGVPNKATFITSWTEFVRKFGFLIPDSYLPYAVSQFFENGGKRCYVVRVLNDASAVAAETDLPSRETDRPAPPTLKVKAKGAGDWGSDLTVLVEDATTNPTAETKLVVLHEGEVVEVFDDLSHDPAAVNYVVTAVNGASEYIEVTDQKLAAAAKHATMESTAAPGLALTGLQLTLERPNGEQRQVAFGAAPATPQDLVDWLNSEWGAFNVAASINDAGHLVLIHNETGYENYFRVLGTAAPVLNLASDFAQGTGPAAPAVLKSDTATGTPPSFNIADNSDLTFQVTTGLGSDPAITYKFLTANNGGSPNWEPATIASALETLFGTTHNGILKARVEGNRVVVESANRGQNDSRVTVVADVGLGFAPIDRDTTAPIEADGQGYSEPAFLQSAPGPFSLEQDANFYIVVNNDADAKEFAGVKRIQVKLTTTHINNFQQAKVDEIVQAINAALSEDSMINASTHIEAIAFNNRVIVRQKVKGPHYSIQVVDGQKSPNIRLEFQGARQSGFAQGDAASPYYRPAIRIVAGVNEPYELTGGSDGSLVSDFDYIGTADKKTGLHALDAVDDVNFIAIPGNSAAGVIGQAVGYCTIRGNCFFIADSIAPKNGSVTGPAEIRSFLLNDIPTKTSYGALYYPWLLAADPVGAGRNPTRLLPPSGFVAGLYARIDTTRGVWKAPAGTEATIIGALGLEYSVTDAEQDILNPPGVNCLRRFAAAGLVIWGARTLGTQSDPEWRYIPIRRYAIYLRESIYRGTQWAVFEPNDAPLWESLKANIEDFMMGEFRKGALAGSTPDEAFEVRCDADLNPPSEVNAGRLNMEVKFAPLRPAEFVIIRISQRIQKPGG